MTVTVSPPPTAPRPAPAAASVGAPRRAGRRRLLLWLPTAAGIVAAAVVLVLRLRAGHVIDVRDAARRAHDARANRHRRRNWYGPRAVSRSQRLPAGEQINWAKHDCMERWLAQILAVVAATVSCQFAAYASPTQWLQFRLDGSHRGSVAGSLRVAWSTRAFGPISESPSISGGLAFVGDNAGSFRALDVRTGHVVWLRQLDNPVMSSPVVTRNLVIVGIGNEISYVRSGEVHVGTGGSALMAFDSTTGRTVWRQPLLGTAMPSPALVNGTLVEPDGNGDVVGLDPASGAVRYVSHVGTTASMTEALPIGGGRVAFAGQTETKVVAVDGRTGIVAWSHAFPSASGLGDCPLAFADGRIIGGYLAPLAGEPYVRAGRRNEQRAFALRASDGAMLWDVALERGIVPLRNQSAIPLISNGVVFVGSAIAPAMHALDARNGRVIWRAEAGGPVKGAPLQTNSALVFGDLSGRVWAIDRRSGRTIAVRSIGVAMNVGSPVLFGRTFIVGGANGALVALPIDLLTTPVRIATAGLVGPTPAMTRQLRVVDRNHDGVLEMSEVSAKNALLFTACDRNHDGMLAAREAVQFLRYRIFANGGRG